MPAKPSPSANKTLLAASKVKLVSKEAPIPVVLVVFVINGYKTPDEAAAVFILAAVVPDAEDIATQDRVPDVSDCKIDVPDPGNAVGKEYTVVVACPAAALKPT